MKKKHFKLFCLLPLMAAIGLTMACSSDDDSNTVTVPSAILGEWELDTVCFVFGDEHKVPAGKRDTYLFGPNGKVQVVRGDWDDLFFFIGVR